MLSVTVVPAPLPDVISSVPLQPVRAPLHAHEALAVALGRRVEPDAVVDHRQHQPRAFDAQVDLHTRTPEWRAALLTASLKIRSRSRRTSTPSCTIVAGAGRVEAQLDVAQREHLVGVLAHPRVRSSRLSRFGLMAQTMSLIELTDSRAMRAIDGQRSRRRPRAPAAGHLAEQRDAREVGADVVVQVGRDARAHVGHLEQPRHAIPVERVGRSAPTASGGDERQEPPALPDGTQDREGDGRRMGAHDPVGVHRPDEER